MNNELAGYFLYNEEYKEWEETHAGTPNSVPLYTHPVELSDEEIYEIGKQYLTQYEDGLYDFARAILKKASEK